MVGLSAACFQGQPPMIIPAKPCARIGKSADHDHAMQAARSLFCVFFWGGGRDSFLEDCVTLSRVASRPNKEERSIRTFGGYFDSKRISGGDVSDGY
jgi:hypothetical protein